MVLLGGNVFKITWRFSSDDDIFFSDWIGPLLLTLAYVISLFLLVLERRQNVHSSVLHFYFWLLHFLVNIPQFVKDVEDLSNLEFQTETLISALTTLPFLWFQVVNHSFSDHSVNLEGKPHEANSSHISFITFTWMDSLIWRG